MAELSDILEQFKGKSADDIAAMVKRRHIKGRTGTTSRCPMALLLRGQNTGEYVIGRKYIVRRSGDNIQKVRTPRNIAVFVRKFDIAGYPDLIAPPPRCLAKEPRNRAPDTRKKPSGDKRIIKNHLAKLVDRFGQGVTP